MKRLLSVLLLIFAAGPAVAQGDLPTVLVGRWEGKVNMKRDNQPRALVVKSVQGSTAQGAFGDPKGRLHDVDITIESVNDQVILKFTNPGQRGGPIELTLARDGKHMAGSLFRHAGRVRGESDPLDLEKVK